jgi:predicted Rdx family selenoprotein
MTPPTSQTTPNPHREAGWPEIEQLRERVRDFIYDCTRDEFGHGWTLSKHQTDDLIALIRGESA